MQVLAEGSIDSLKYLTISEEDEWFENRDDESIAPLFVFLSR